jgi:hypothetical protein
LKRNRDVTTAKKTLDSANSCPGHILNTMRKTQSV